MWPDASYLLPPAKRLQMRSWQEEAHPLQARTPGRMLGLGNARYVLFSTLDSLIKHNVWVVCTSTQRKRRRKRRKVWVHQGFKRLHVLPILGCVVHQRKPKQQQRSAQTKTARRENHLIIPWWRNCLKGKKWNSWIPAWWNICNETLDTSPNISWEDIGMSFFKGFLLRLCI